MRPLRETRRAFRLTVAALLLGAWSLVPERAAAQTGDLNPRTSFSESSLNLLGAGARAMGMGGAFIALADDATAASWNPSGLAQLVEREASLVTGIHDGSVRHDYESRTTSDGSSTDFRESYPFSTTSDGAIEFASVTSPFSLFGQAAVAQVSYRKLSSFLDGRSGGSWSWENVNPSTDTLVNADAGSVSVEADRSGGIESFGGSVATELLGQLRVGVSVNWIDASVDERIDIEADGWYYRPGPCSPSSGHYRYAESYRMRYRFSGLQSDVGIQWTPTSRWTFGAVYHAGFESEFRYEKEVSWAYEGCGGSDSLPPLDETTRLRWPNGWGAGVAYRPLQPLTLVLDYSQTDWSEARIASYKDFSGEQRTALFPSFGTNQSDGETIRLGAEWVFLPKDGLVIPIRAGLFQEKPQAAYFALYQSAPTHRGFSLGTGVRLGRFQFDLAWVRTWGSERLLDSAIEGVILRDRSGRAEIETNRFLVSGIVQF